MHLHLTPTRHQALQATHEAHDPYEPRKTLRCIGRFSPRISGTILINRKRRVRYRGVRTGSRGVCHYGAEREQMAVLRIVLLLLVRQSRIGALSLKAEAQPQE